MLDAISGFLCRVVPYTREYSLISNMLWDATLPFFIQGILCWRLHWQVVYAAAAFCLFLGFHWAFRYSDIDSIWFSLLYWAVIYILVAAITGIISGRIVRAITWKRNRILLVVIHFAIWFAGYYVAIEWMQRTADKFPAYSC